MILIGDHEVESAGIWGERVRRGGLERRAVGGRR